MTTAASYVILLSSAAPGDSGRPLTDVPAESADCAVTLIRLQARSFAMAPLDDHHLRQWLEHGWLLTRRTILKSHEVRLTFIAGDCRIARTVRPLPPPDGDAVLPEPSRRLEPLTAVRCEQDAAEVQPPQSATSRVESASAAVRWIHRHVAALVKQMGPPEAQQASASSVARTWGGGAG